ncbi:hypothetical protein L596_028186 [Steinernema carpocapsae]|uniref:Septin-type G domain-containing protein n=1 Tax=Steinernema carpocapsae TaxID=34508 RepID=A0A4U5LXP3_STECR|nr:hypothetical protein L596_028186 [Steinernema carpocapsae]
MYFTDTEEHFEVTAADHTHVSLYATPQRPHYTKRGGVRSAASASVRSPPRTPSTPSMLRSLPDAQEFVGFGNFPNQIFRRAIKEGFEFTLMVVGESGLGKSTFIDTLFLTEVNGSTGAKRNESASTVSIESKTVRLVENDVNLNLTFVDTPGFGDAVDNSHCWAPIMEFIDTRFAEYLGEETKILRKSKIPDRRVHLCLYFIAPTGHGLKRLDIECMKNLHDRVNIIPVIAKADTLTTHELVQFKKRINGDIAKNDIRIYQFPENEDESGEFPMPYERNRYPFAVVGSNVTMKSETTGCNVRVREYPWGIVEVENIGHNDFISLRDLIIRKNLIDLIDVTKNVHYENFRYRHMCANPNASDERDPFTQLEQEQRIWENEFNKRVTRRSACSRRRWRTAPGGSRRRRPSMRTWRKSTSASWTCDGSSWRI